MCLVCGEAGEREGGTDRQTGRQAGRQADRQTGRQTEKMTVMGSVTLIDLMGSVGPRSNATITS